MSVVVVVFFPQYAYQEEQERPLHAPTTQCCECHKPLLHPPPPVLSPAVSFLCLLFFLSSPPLLHRTDNGTRQEVEMRLIDEAKEEGRKADVTNHACKAVWVEWLIGARCLMNVNWHTMGCQTHTALPCLSVCRVMMTQGASVYSINPWTEGLDGGTMLVCAEMITACVYFLCLVTWQHRGQQHLSTSWFWSELL